MQEKECINGIDVERLFVTIEQIKDNPMIAQFAFRAVNTWVDDTHNRATVADFYGALQNDSSRTPLAFEIDEPPVLCGNNLGANPVEYLLVALAGCLTTTLVAHAAAKGISIKKVESRYEGELELQGFLGLSSTVPVGYRNIRVFFKIEADISDAHKKELVKMAQKYSPVYNSITKPVEVTVHLD